MTYIPNILVPVQNSANNTFFTDVIGNKTDNQNGDSLASKLHIADEHFHAPSKVYPTLANGVTVTGGAGAWELGDFAVVVPTNAITSQFDIHRLNVSAYNANDTFELILYSGSDGNEVEIGRTRITRLTNVGASPHVYFQTPIVPANSQIKAKVATQNGTSNTITFSIVYHNY